MKSEENIFEKIEVKTEVDFDDIFVPEIRFDSDVVQEEPEDSSSGSESSDDEKNPDSSEHNFNCEYCTNTYMRKAGLVRHYRQVHSNILKKKHQKYLLIRKREVKTIRLSKKNPKKGNHF